MARRKNQISFENVVVENYDLEDGELSWEDAVQSFIADRRLRNLSEHTIDSYKNKLKYFMLHLDEIKLEARPQKITYHDIKAVMTSLLGRNVTIEGVNSELRAVRAFFNFLEEEGLVRDNPVRRLKLLKQEKKIVMTFTREEIVKMLGKTKKKTFTGFRDYVLMLFMLETGVRVRELCDITMDDIIWREGLVKIHGKNGEERYVPIQETMKRELDKYVQFRGKLPTDYLWVTIDGVQLSRRMVQQQVQYYGKLAGVRKEVRCSPHTFRHTFAKLSVENGANLFALQQVLGHKSLEMVRRYVQMFSRDVSKDHAKFSPLKSLLT